MLNSLVVIHLGLESHLVVQDYYELPAQPSSDFFFAVAEVFFGNVAIASKSFIVTFLKLELKNTCFL